MARKMHSRKPKLFLGSDKQLEETKKRAATKKKAPTKKKGK